MWIRRGLFYWQFAAIVALPTWVLIARGILGSTVGWDFFLFLVLCSILAAGMLVIAGLTVARLSVRESRAVSWPDVATIAAWHGVIIAYGFVDAPVLAAFVVVLAVVAFWVAVWQLFSETRRRVQGVLAGFEATSGMPGTATRSTEDISVIVIDPRDSH